MSARKFRAVATSLVLVAAASLSAIAATAPAEAAKATDPIHVSINKKRIITMPTTIQPGVNEFQVMTTAKQSEFQIAMPAAGYTAEEAARDVEKGLEQGKTRALKRFEANLTLYGGVPVTADRPGVMWATLPAGTFWAIDVNTNDPEKFYAFTVAGPDTGNVVPAGPTLKAKGSTKWARSPLSIPNKGTLTFKNAASENHFVDMVKLRKGKTVRDFKTWLLAPAGPSGPPPVDFSKIVHLGVVSPGVSMTAKYRAAKGNYVIVCFWPDADEGGTPHAFMGMIRGIKLT